MIWRKSLVCVFPLLLLCLGVSVATVIPDGYTLVPSKGKRITSLSELKDGVYFVELFASRTECGGSPTQEFLGFNNRTCSTALSPAKTAGPIMRATQRSVNWKEWTFRVMSSNEDEVHVSLQAFINPDVEGDARCLGYLSSFYGNPEYQGTCDTAPYGNGLFLNDTKSSQMNVSAEAWTVRRPRDNTDGAFELIATSKPGECSRFMAAEGCKSSVVLVDDSSRSYTKWKMVKRYDLVPTKPSPSPSPAPVPFVPVSAEIPPPVISAPSTTSTGSVNVVVNSVGGNSNCVVGSLVITATGNSIGSVPSSVEVSASQPGLGSTGVPVTLRGTGYNSIYAYGKCNAGGNEKTLRSNGLTVYYGSTPVASVPFVGVNLLGSNYGNDNTGASNVFTKFPIETGKLVEVESGDYKSVSLSGNTAVLVPPEVTRRRRLHTGLKSKVCYDMSANAPVFVDLDSLADEDVKDMSISGTAGAAVVYVYIPPSTFTRSILYSPHIASTNFSVIATDLYDQVSLSGTGLLASYYDCSENSWVYTPDVGNVNLTKINTSGLDLGGVGYFSLSGTAAAGVDSTGRLFYTSDISNPTWQVIPGPSTSFDLREVSLAGKELVVVDANKDPDSYNTWYTKDITAVVDASSWINIEAALRSVSISEKPYTLGGWN